MADVVDVASFAEEYGVLVSRVSHPVPVEYGDGHVRVSPRGVTQKLLKRLLPAELPEGITFIPR